ncbi:MAG TPA: GNAT family N-acyltransferase [Vicinamibacterales bacterium]|nr:GNAT family N-acyltransferase [Vicinamibacterales bacterium]
MADTAIIPGDPFSLQLAQQTPLARAAFVAARPFLRAMLQLARLRTLYARAQTLSGGSFESRALRTLDIRFQVQSIDPTGIPSRGPLIVAANHPTGARDGLVLLEAMRQIRPDVRLLANHLLSRIPELRDSCFFVDPFGGPSSAARSLEGLRAAHVWLRRGGALIVFPAGEVAWQPDGTGGHLDSPWLPAVGRLALGTAAPVLPVFLDGQNSPTFYAAGRVHPALRTVMLAREFLQQRGTCGCVCLGRTIAPAVLRRLDTAEAVTGRIREAVDALTQEPRPAHHAEIAAALDPALLEDDVAMLPADARLLSSGVYDVFCVTADAIPNVLLEIGRLREVTFRAVGEGTGNATDLDCYDGHYHHLFVWNRVRRQVVGAYRVGMTDCIDAEYGPSGLYTTSLFRYDDRLLRRLSPALELGRSFVRAEYQRSHNALFLLWRGIGRLVARSPKYRVLFGPVSISARYGDLTQQMLRVFLTQNHCNAELAALVEGIHPPGELLPPARAAARVADADELDALIRRIEQDQGIPVLLRQYLRLNASLLGFNVDPAFGDALDALMMVDLTRLPAATLQRYLGRDEAQAFLVRHQIQGASKAAA